MENKYTQSTFLNNSIYLKNLKNETHDFNKNDDIMIEEPLG